MHTPATRMTHPMREQKVITTREGQLDYKPILLPRAASAKLDAGTKKIAVTAEIAMIAVMP
jgi:hypothetical protein